MWHINGMFGSLIGIQLLENSFVTLPYTRDNRTQAVPVNTAREHECSVHTTRVHGPCSRASFLETREHGPSRPAGAIVKDVIIIFCLQDAWNSTDYQYGPLTRAAFTGVQNDTRVHGPRLRPVNMAREHR